MSAEAAVNLNVNRNGNVESKSVENKLSTDALDNTAIMAVRRATREAALNAVAACAVRAVYGAVVNEDKMNDVRPQIVRAITGLNPKQAAKEQRRAYDFASFGCKVATDLVAGEWNIHEFDDPDAAVQDVADRLKSAYGSMDALSAHYGKGKSKSGGNDGDPLKAITKAFAKSDNPETLAKQALRLAAIYLAQSGADFDTSDAQEVHASAVKRMAEAAQKAREGNKNPLTGKVDQAKVDAAVQEVIASMLD